MCWSFAVDSLVGEQGRDRRGPHRDIFAAAEDNVDEAAQKRAVQAVLRWESRDVGVRQSLRDDSQPDCYSRHQIPNSTAAVVFWQPVQNRYSPVQHLSGASAVNFPLRPRLDGLRRRRPVVLFDH